MKLKNLYYLALFISTFSIFFFPTLLYAQSTTPWSFYNNPLNSNSMDIFYNGSGSVNPAVRVLPTGEVGIGVTPRANYLIDIGATNSTKTTGLTGALRLKNYSNSGWAYIDALDGTGSVGMNFRPSVNGALRDGMILTSTGNVGIGTANQMPIGLLQVGKYDGSVDSKGGIVIASGTGVGGARQYWIGASTNPYSHNNNNFAIADYDGTTTVNLMTIFGVHNGASTGFTGIGQTNPHRRLDVSSDGGNDGITFGSGGTDNSQTIQTYIDTHWTDRATYAGGCCNPLLLQPDVGNVVIGTTVGPTAKLHVQGTTKITGAVGLYGYDPLGCGNTTGDNVTPYGSCIGGSTFIQTDLRVGRWLGLNGYGALGCGSYGLCVGGAAWSNAAFYDGSDIRTKKNIRPIKDALNKVLALEGVNFEFRAENYPGKNYPTDTQMGFIAQQVEPILPEVVETGKDADGLKSIAYAHITAVLVEAVKEQNKQIQDLKQEIGKQKETNNLQNEELQSLKNQLLELKKTIEELKH